MSVSLCALHLEIDSDCIKPKYFSYLAPHYECRMANQGDGFQSQKYPSHSENIKSKCRGKREPQNIEIETYENHNKDDGPWEIAGSKNKKSGGNKQSKTDRIDEAQPGTSKESSPTPLPLSTEVASKTETNFKKPSHEQKSFFSGNPFVEKVQGILHFYKENCMTSLDEDVPRSQMICMLAIPAWLSCTDLLNFLAPCCPGIRRVRIIRDSTPNQYMALVLFRSQEEADECYKTFNGTPYNSMESDLCHLVYMARVEIGGEEEIDFSRGMIPPASGLTELPICTVCLERMDESVDGILTILCNHSFHGACLAKWVDTTCPVCRYIQSPGIAAESSCSECTSIESLWICLICGYIGCGRYVGGHAYNHFMETQHCYSMQLGNTRVWDYVGDNFVHRLLQNNADGKLVEVEGRSTNNSRPSYNKGENMEHEEKLDSVQLEYLYLLQNQLASQKLHFEGIIERVEQQHHKEIEDTKEKIKTILKENDKLRQKDKKMSTKLLKAISDLQEEKELNRSLVANQASWHEKVSKLEQQQMKMREEKDTSIRELQEQLQDIMLYFEAQEKCKNTELEGGQVVLGPSASQSSESHKGAKNKRRAK